MTFVDRKQLAESHEYAIQVELERRGWSVQPFGIALLADEVRDALRRVQPPSYWRWLPDLVAMRDGRMVLIDGKDEQRKDTPNFAIEEMALAAHRNMAFFGIPIVYVFSDMSCNWNSDDFAYSGRRFAPMGSSGRVEGVRGSGTPFVLVPKSQQLHLDDIFGPPLDMDDLLW